MNINVTKPFLPPRAEFDSYVDGIWKRQWLTNNGPLVNELELELKKKLGLEYLLFMGNGTVALEVAIKALDLGGEIITTPFSYVATTSSIVWSGCTPVMVDIEPAALNIDASRIEAAITDRTSAILATHVYGNPCDVDLIGEIARKHRLKVIYDAAHAFGVRYKGKSLYSYGDVATASFHATKIFHTIEGGAVFTHDPAVLKRMAGMRNFGHASPTDFDEVGINGKNSELHAAMGLCNLKHIDSILQRRRDLSRRYDANLSGVAVRKPLTPKDCDYNHAYYPIILENEATLLSVVDSLNMNYIFPRRYFYPSLSSLPYVSAAEVPISEDICKRVLCLPLYHELSLEEIDMICRLINRTIRYGA